MAQITASTGGNSAIQAEKVSGPWRDAWRTFRKNKIAMIGLIMIVLFVIIALLAPVVAPYDFKAQ
ncbi:ABC transporter permease, partial [Paenibacillus macerans]|nr:ABC transporter permease [Paenibacillus macerans]